jgi:hypothetical protein
VRRVLQPGTDRAAPPGSSLEFFFQTTQVINQYPCKKILIARKLINNKTNKEPTGRLLIPDLITGSKLNNQPTPEQAGVQRVLKTRTDNRLLLGRYLIF